MSKSFYYLVFTFYNDYKLKLFGHTLAKTLVQSTNLQEKGKTYCTPTILLVIFANHLAHNR